MAKKQQKPIEPEEKPDDFEFEDFDEEEPPEVEEFMEIGGSPVPGITLRQVLRGHTDRINRIVWSPDGRYLASPSDDKTIRIWDVERGETLKTISSSYGFVSAAWSRDGKRLATGNQEGELTVWEIDNLDVFYTTKAHKSIIGSINWSINGNRLVSGSDDQILRIWNTSNWKEIISLEGHQEWITVAIWSMDGNNIISGGFGGELISWDALKGTKVNTYVGHKAPIYDLVWLQAIHGFASSSDDGTICIWNIDSTKPSKIIEGHSGRVHGLTISPNGNLLASKSADNTIRLWNTQTWETVAELTEKAFNHGYTGIAFHPEFSRLATLGKDSKIIRIWDIAYDVLFDKLPSTEAVHYTTAKLVLVGDSGVGKTGLGWRLAHNEFKENSSTHGQQFWVVPELKKTREDGTECEAVLWDLAGQPDYRLVHSLYLDDVDTALVLFDPTNRQEPLSGVDFWLNQLKDKDKKLRNSILVGARTDRGTSTLTTDEIKAYCERNGITGGYIPTSAKEGDGLSDLLEKLKDQIPWDEMTTTVTTVTFKKIKEFVLALKEKTDRKNVLVKPAELREQLQATDEEWEFSDAEMMTAVGHLETHGYVKVIHSSNGEHTILLSPDVLANLASSIVLEARRNPRGLGVLEEDRLLRGEYPFPELNNINKAEGIILLDATAVLFLERNLCFRETFNNQTFLVFPSLINEKRPADEAIKTEEGASYRVKGAVENVYASLVVLLGYTNTFIRTHQWQNQAQYEMGEGEICGFIQSEYKNGEIELVLYYGQKTPDPVRLTFRGLFERFLSRRELEISRYQPVTCHKCGALLARNVVTAQLIKGKDFSFCHECGEKLQLPSPEPVSRLSRREEVIMDIQQAIAQRRTAFEAALVRVKALLRDQGKETTPSCFISYSWGVPEHERWVVQFAKDLRNAGINVLLDRWHSPPGADLGRYMDQIMKCDFVAVVGTPQLLNKYETRATDPVVAAELRLINVRLREPSVYGQTVIPVLLDGDVRSSFIPMLQTLVRVDFKQSAYYFRQLFDMIWRMYNLSFENPLLEELQASMTPQDR